MSEPVSCKVEYIEKSHAVKVGTKKLTKQTLWKLDFHHNFKFEPSIGGTPLLKSFLHIQ